MKADLLILAGQKQVVIAINPITVNFTSSTEGYDFDDYQSFNVVSAIVSDQATAEAIVNDINALYANNRATERKIAHLSIEQYGDFAGQMRIHVKQHAGYRGMTSPMNFSIQQYEPFAKNRAGSRVEE